MQSRDPSIRTSFLEEKQRRGEALFCRITQLPPNQALGEAKSEFATPASSSGPFPAHGECLGRAYTSNNKKIVRHILIRVSTNSILRIPLVLFW